MENNGGREAYGSRSPLFDSGILVSAELIQDYLNFLNKLLRIFVTWHVLEAVQFEHFIMLKHIGRTFMNQSHVFLATKVSLQHAFGTLSVTKMLVANITFVEISFLFCNIIFMGPGFIVFLPV